LKMMFSKQNSPLTRWPAATSLLLEAKICKHKQLIRTRKQVFCQRTRTEREQRLTCGNTAAKYTKTTLAIRELAAAMYTGPPRLRTHWKAPSAQNRSLSSLQSRDDDEIEW